MRQSKKGEKNGAAEMEARVKGSEQKSSQQRRLSMRLLRNYRRRKQGSNTAKGALASHCSGFETITLKTLKKKKQS